MAINWKNGPKTHLQAVFSAIFHFLGHFSPHFVVRPNPFFGDFFPILGQARTDFLPDRHVRKSMSFCHEMSQDVVLLVGRCRDNFPGVPFTSSPYGVHQSKKIVNELLLAEAQKVQNRVDKEPKYCRVLRPT